MAIESDDPAKFVTTVRSAALALTRRTEENIKATKVAHDTIDSFLDCNLVANINTIERSRNAEVSIDLLDRFLAML